MRPVAQGRPGTQVIPDGWSAAHRPVVNKTHGATVSLRRPGGTPGDFDPETGTKPVTPYDPYAADQAARIQVLPALEQERLAGEQEITTLAYSVELDAGLSGVQLGDLVAVTAMDDNGDADLVGRELTVRGFETGSLHWERRLICTLNLETQEG